MKKRLVQEKEMMVPEINEPYFYITVSPSYGTFIVQATTWKNYGSDKRRLVKGNLFHTEYEATALAEKYNDMLEEL